MIEHPMLVPMQMYASIGKSSIHIRAELPGDVTNRLQAALWREAYWLVEQGVVSVADVDQAVAGVGTELDGIDQDRMLDERDRLLEQLVVAEAAAHDLPGGTPT